MAFLPFSSRAKAWEPKAQALRGLTTDRRDGLVDPWALASRVGLRVVPATPEVMTSLGADERMHLLGSGSSSWSGGVYPQPLPDGTFLCILNPTHSHRRNKITLMEEICHTHLRHVPTRLVLSKGGVEVRDYNKAQEEEAYGIGAAVLLPWPPFFTRLNGGACAEDIAENFEVTPQLVHYRIKICGAWRLYQSRQNARA